MLERRAVYCTIISNILIFRLPAFAMHITDCSFETSRSMTDYKLLLENGEGFDGYIETDCKTKHPIHRGLFARDSPEC